MNCIPTPILMAELRSRGVSLDAQTVQLLIDQNYSRQELLGAGATGAVYRVKQKSSGLSFALKVLIRKRRNDAHELACLNEIRALQRLQHKNIMNLYETYESETMRWLIVEIVKQGALLSYLEEQVFFSEKSALHIIRQVLDACNYMHYQGVVHRDLKLENIFVKEKGQTPLIKIGDFGAAALVDPDIILDKNCDSITDAFCGTPLYMAPEVARKPAKYGAQCDIWSTAVLAVELLTGKPHIQMVGKFKLRTFFDELQTYELDPKMVADMSPDCQDLIKGLLQPDPSKRLNAGEALQHKIFQDGQKRASTVHQSAVLSNLKRRASLAPINRDSSTSWAVDDHDIGMATSAVEGHSMVQRVTCDTNPETDE